MGNSAQRSRVAVLQEKCGQRHRRRHSKVYGSVRKAVGSTAIVPSEPNLRIAPAAQLEIINLYLQGFSLCEIARRTHRARQTVTKICRSDEIQSKVVEVRERLLGSADRWIESISFALDHELDGRLALELAERFGVAPPQPVNAEPTQQSFFQSIDRETLVKAAVFGMMALQGTKVFGSEPPTEEELSERLVQTAQPEGEATEKKALR
jgi:hypothetical protein